MSLTARILSVAVLLAVTGCKREAPQKPRYNERLRLSKDATAPAERPPVAGDTRLRGCTIQGVQQVVRPHLDEVKGCYRQGIARNPKLSGRLAVEITIDRSGAAKFLGVKQDTLGDHDVTRCIFAVLKPLPYPLPGRDACVIIYPFNFTAGPKK